MSSKNTIEDLWKRIDIKGPNDCWEWQGYKLQFGHGNVTWSGKVKKVHRLIFEAANGAIPKGLWVLHSCDNPPCCNPKHLHLGTAADNMRECVERGRHKGINQNTNKKICKNGHRFTKENTNITKQGWRDCRACNVIKVRKYRALKKAA